MVVRVYGETRGWHSWAVVTKGMARGMSAHGMFAGLYPTDALAGEDDEVPGGADAAVAILCGRPDALDTMRFAGIHAHKYFMLAPNSTWVPEALLVRCEKDGIGLLTPSAWGASVLEAACVRHKVTVPDLQVVPHGILPGFLGATEPSGPFTLMHFATSSMARKGTLELVRAFGKWRGSKEARLVLVLAPRHIPRATLEAGAEGIEIVQAPNGDPVSMSMFYRRAHAIVAPSRAEGFGLIPLEARACGVPVLMTDCSGHLEHMPPEAVATGLAEGVVRIRSGALAPLEGELDGLARAIDEEAIIEALDVTNARWDELKRDAVMLALSVRRRWDWAEVTRNFCDKVRAP